MAITDFPWFKIYAAETLSDENFSSWTVEQRGIWFTLLCHCWKEGSIPSDTDKLARLCGCDARAFLGHWSGIAHRFHEHTDPSRLVSLRLEFERQNSVDEAQAKSNHGRKGANARWDKYKNDMLGHCPSNAHTMPNHAPQPQPEHITYVRPKNKKQPANKVNGVKVAPTDPRKILQDCPPGTATAFWDLVKVWPKKDQKMGVAATAYLEAIKGSDPLVIHQAAELVARGTKAEFCTSLGVWLSNASWLAFTGGQ